MKTYEIISFKNRYDKLGVIQKLSFEVMVKAFKANVIRTKETFLEYESGDRDFKLKCKDKGAFIAGKSINNSRESKSITSRNMITLDMDYCPPNILEILRDKQDNTKELNFPFFVYSTHSHTPENPRLRLIVPLSEEISVEKYEPIGRAIANIIGIEYFDATTFQINRIMYFPSVSIDGDYLCEDFGLDEWNILQPDDMLDRYLDYLNIAEFQKPHYISGLSIDRIKKGQITSSKKTKYRIVNAFNIEYTIIEAIDNFLSDVYVKGKHADRYTFVDGESIDGLVILNDEYAYSHHATDPAQGKLLNAFDIVRIHKFGKQDTDITEQYEYEKYDKSSSFSAMVDFIRDNVKQVMKHMPEIQKVEQNQKEYETGEIEVDKNSVEEEDWTHTLDYMGSKADRKPKSNARNVKIIFEKDEKFKDLFYFDSLRDAICFYRTPDWNPEKSKGDMLDDEDDSQIRFYLETVYQIRSKEMIFDAVVHQASKRRIHPIKTFLAQLPEWDGVKRIEEIICNLYDIQPNAFYREASKAWWVGIVQRIMRPGSKFDMMVVISGQQGIGKSQFGKSIATLEWGKNMTTIDTQPNYFGDDELPFDKKDAYEQLGGIMIYELPEFEKYYKKSDASTIKSFVSKTTDKFRRSYGRRVTEYRRQCVFIATTNDNQPLRDRTGNRRFLPFYSRLPRNTSRLYDENYWTIDIRNQCLAESMHYYEEGFNPMTAFSEEAKMIWDELNDKATVENDSLPIVEMYVNNKFPKNFYSLSFDEMKDQWHERKTKDFRGLMIDRETKDIFSMKEIYTIAFNKPYDANPDYLMREQITHALDHLGFVKINKRKAMGIFGQVSSVYKRLEQGGNDEQSEENLPF
jgi:putative DNA primase/helicase